VTAYRLVAAGTIEEKILQLKAKKRELVATSGLERRHLAARGLDRVGDAPWATALEDRRRGDRVQGDAEHADLRAAGLEHDVRLEDGRPRLGVDEVRHQEGERRLLAELLEHGAAQEQVAVAQRGRLTADLVVLREHELGGILDLLLLRTGGRRQVGLPEQIASVEDQVAVPVLRARPALDDCGFLGKTAKRISPSATGLELTGHVGGVQDGELVAVELLGGRGLGRLGSLGHVGLGRGERRRRRDVRRLLGRGRRRGGRLGDDLRVRLGAEAHGRCGWGAGRRRGLAAAAQEGRRHDDTQELSGRKAHVRSR
jgi:hypothetical protein